MLAPVSVLSGRCRESLVAMPLQLASSSAQTHKYLLNPSIRLQYTVKHMLLQFSLPMSMPVVPFPVSFQETLMGLIFLLFFLPMCIVKLEGPGRLGFVEGLKAVIVKRGLFGVLHVEIQVIRGGPVGCVSRG